jgi:hypothetical protein
LQNKFEESERRRMKMDVIVNSVGGTETKKPIPVFRGSIEIWISRMKSKLFNKLESLVP